jgi:O-antigen/teichoic acid export membrane protein
MSSPPLSDRASPLGQTPGRLRQILTGRLARATGWTAIAMIIAQFIRLGGNLIMTRLLPPDMFGVMSIVFSVQITIVMVLDIGLRTALIQSKRGEDPVLLNTAWTVQIIRCAVVWGLNLAFAASIPSLVSSGVIPAGSAWTAPELPLVLAITSFGFVLNSFESTNVITAERHLALKRVVLLQITGQFVGLIAMILLGWTTGSIWALASASLVSTFVVSALSHFVLPGIRNRLLLDKEARRELSKYGFWTLISSGAFVLGANADRFILGGIVDTHTLGLYAIALNLAMILTGLGASFLSSVVMPALSEVAREDDPEKFRRKYFQLRLPWDIGFLLAAGALVVLGPMVVRILYDDRYLGAGPMLQILALSLVMYRYNFTGFAYMAYGRMSAMASLNVVRLVSVIVFLFVGYHWFGFTGALVAIALHPLPIIPVMVYLNRELNINSLRFELLVLLAFPAGYAGGWVVLQVLHMMLGY